MFNPVKNGFATEKQISFINSLIAQKDTSGLDGFVGENLMDVMSGKQIDRIEASNLIEAMLKLPKYVDPKVQPLVPGIYERAGVVYKVQFNKMKTNVYGKKMVFIGGRRLTEGDEIVHFEWEYIPNIAKYIKAEDKLDADKVGELGLKYGQCLVCGRGLKDAFSVQRGIGPVCYKNYGDGIVED